MTLYRRSPFLGNDMNHNVSFYSLIVNNYKLETTIKVYCFNDVGDNTCEVYGSLFVNIGSLAQNQNVEILKKDQSNHVSTVEGTEVVISSQTRYFQEVYGFRNSANFADRVTFTGEFKEYDNGGTDEVLASITGKPDASLNPSEIYNVYQHQRFTEGINYVEISVKLSFHYSQG